MLRTPLESDPIVRFHALRAYIFAVRNITRLAGVRQPRVTKQHYIPAKGPVALDIDGICRGKRWNSIRESRIEIMDVLVIPRIQVNIREDVIAIFHLVLVRQMEPIGSHDKQIVGFSPAGNAYGQRIRR